MNKDDREEGKGEGMRIKWMKQCKSPPRDEERGVGGDYKSTYCVDYMSNLDEERA